MTNLTTTAPKTPLTKRAFWLVILNATLLSTHLIRYILRLPCLTATAANYATLIPIRQAIGILCIIVLLAVLILSVIQAGNPEKEDELAKLHRYKAGYISFYILLFAVIFLIYSVKNFEPALIGDFIDNANIAIMFLAFSQCLENIVFIYLEKHSLE